MPMDNDIEVYSNLFNFLCFENPIWRNRVPRAIREIANTTLNSVPGKVRALIFAYGPEIKPLWRSAFPNTLVTAPEKTCAPAFFIAATLMGITGCSLSDGITRGSIDYNESLEEVTNNMLVTNILLARDQAPLHFTDLSQIRGAFQFQTQAQISGPFGPNLVSTTRVRDVFQSGVTLNSNPTFDVVPLNTKDFTTGITTPIDLKFLQYYLNRGWPPNYIYNIFIEKIDISTNYSNDHLECEFINTPGKTLAPETQDFATCNDRAYQVFGVPSNGHNVTFRDILPIIKDNLSFTTYNKVAPYGPEITVVEADFLKNADKLSAGGLELSEKLPSGRYRVLKKTRETAVCLEPDPTEHRPYWHRFQLGTLGSAVSRTLSDQSTDVDICARSGERDGKENRKTGGTKAPQVVLYLRSVEAIITFLGQMLLIEKADRALPFDISPEESGETRFGVYYRGQNYYVNETRKTCRYLKSIGSGKSCNEEEDEDQTLFILAILNQTLNLYKNANEIPTTKAVQSVP
jgi:hypothetical protein